MKIMRYCILLATALLTACSDGASAGVKATSDALAATIQAQATQAAEVSARLTASPTTTITIPPASPGGQSSGDPGIMPYTPGAPTEVTQSALGGVLPPTESADATQATNPDPAQSTAQAAEQLQAFEAIKAQLPAYGVDPTQGKPGWTHPPVTLTARGKDGSAFANDHLQLLVKDFVLSADITWNTRYGDSGCGFFLRSDGDPNQPSQYTMVITRGSNGHLLFSVMVDSEVLNTQDVYANGMDDKFQVKNDTTNNLTVVGRGGFFTAYTNGTKLGDLDPRKPPKMPPLPEAPQQPNSSDTQAQETYQKALAEYNQQVAHIKSEYQTTLRRFNATNVVFDQGLVALFTTTQGGDVECIFDHAWLWLIQ